MKLLFRTDGNATIGLGHVMRCLALAQAAREAGHSSIFVMTPNEEKISDRLQEEHCTVISMKARPGSREDATETANLAREHGADWIIVDGYQFDGDYQKAIREGDVPLLFIDDYGHAKQYAADIILNQNFYAEEMEYQSDGISPQLLLGPQYALLRQEFVQWKRHDRLITEEATKILISMGGADAENTTGRILQCLQNLDRTGLEITIVSGAANPHKKLLEKAAVISRHPTHLLFNVTNMAALMAEADIGISAGGSTCYELLYMGLPAIVFITADNQERNVHALERGHAIVGAGRNADTLTHLLKSLLSDQSKRGALSMKGRGIVDGLGCSRVLSAMQLTHGKCQ
ncbi:UDP-2,4-diacetamido-2,4,6-trideoxy-beta-L-altropyranose hydrolase [Candidatus Peregrinibacteria bacterium CG1_02_54_53]|nr:MAG: UDP-2,4-diacetamido-2,4,6-trideoxy-beta-L-altropyranose hydrolase [Candidatus Peregrinibacteria bacterium CG1_02_54_53]